MLLASKVLWMKEGLNLTRYIKPAGLYDVVCLAYNNTITL
jgi:hypothetical protein